MRVTRVAAIDCGTNSIRLLIAEGERGSRDLVDVVRDMEVVRLGQGVDRTGRFDPVALERTLVATRRYADACAREGVDAVRFVATSATRDAANRDEFLDGVRGILGIAPEVVPGTEEAALSFAGATRTVSAAESSRGQVLVVDLGGGSTELVAGEAGTPVAAHSMDVGCVRLTERHVSSDPVGEADREAVRADVRAALDAAERDVPLDGIRTVVGVAGSITTITALALGLDRYEPPRINGARLELSRVLEACARMTALPREERAALGFMHPGRVDVIQTGALVWAEVLARVHARSGVDEVVTSEHDILDGIALGLLDRA